MKRIGVCLLIAFCALVFPQSLSWAAHPLITDDPGTQGRGHVGLEMAGQYDYDRERAGSVTVKQTNAQASAQVSYGIIDNTDLVVSLPYVWDTTSENGVKVYDERGISDSTFEVKWRFFEKEGMSFALKPGVVLPTGDERKGLGSGRAGYHLFLIGAREAAPWSFYANVGYIRNESIFDEERNLWHISLAATYDVSERLKLVGNAGAEKNPIKGDDNDPAFMLGGVIYSLTDHTDIDFGIKYGLTSAEKDFSALAGTTIRF